MAEVTAAEVHRQAFIQAVMARGCMPEAEAKQIHRSLCQAPSSTNDYLSFIAECNSKLEYVHFEIRTMKGLSGRDKWVGFVNKVADDVAKSITAWPSTFNHAQLSFFKAIVERLASEEPDSAHIDSISACNLGLDSSQSQAESSTQATIRKLSVNEKQETLNQLAAQHWLDRHPTISGSYCIGIRTLLELKQYLLSLEVPEATKQAWDACGI